MNLEFSGERFVPGKSPKRLEAEHLERYEFASRFVSSQAVMDIACGSGYGSGKLADAGAAFVDGVDIAADAIEYAEAHFAKPGVAFSIGDIANFMSDKRYDVVVCFETIEHVADYKSALSNLYQSLKPGGTLIISSPNRLITSPRAKTLHDRPANRFHTQEFTLEEFILELRTHQFIVSGSAVYGQRSRLYVKNRYVAALYRKLLQPDLKASPVVMPVNGLAPRVIVIVATKPGN